MMIEVRRLDSDGVAHQYTVGKVDGEHVGEPTEMIHWDDGRHSVKVYPNEVFTADEAAEVFYAYFLTDTVSKPHVLRGGKAKVENLHKRDTIASIQVAVDLQGVIGH